MSISKFNAERYYDPTAYEAMTAIEKEERALRAFRPIVYICSPYAGDVPRNVEKAQQRSQEIHCEKAHAQGSTCRNPADSRAADFVHHLRYLLLPVPVRVFESGSSIFGLCAQCGDVPDWSGGILCRHPCTGVLICHSGI